MVGADGTVHPEAGQRGGKGNKSDPGGRRIYVRGLAGCQEQGKGDIEEALRQHRLHAPASFTVQSDLQCILAICAA